MLIRPVFGGMRILVGGWDWILCTIQSGDIYAPTINDESGDVAFSFSLCCMRDCAAFDWTCMDIGKGCRWYLVMYNCKPIILLLPTSQFANTAFISSTTSDIAVKHNHPTSTK